jgi:hypothetical protein
LRSGQGTRCFAGLDQNRQPIWSRQEADAVPIVTSGTMGDLSVTWCNDLDFRSRLTVY